MVSNSTSEFFPIIGIGASAGGLEAFEQFLSCMPTDSGMAVVLVPHLDPSHDSLLVEILQRTTKMPVLEAEDQALVEPNCVYVIPPNRDMAIFHGFLQLTLPELPRGQRMPIDAFFRSLAEDQQENAVGIILSGTGTDGTLGLRAILGAGGLTLAQSPETAKYDGMPLSTIKSGYACHVLPVKKMPDAILQGVRAQFSRTKPAKEIKIVSGINHILCQLRSITGHDFSLYKETTISRRIERRMLQHNIDDSDIYARYLQENPDEAHALVKALLINVTSFFRDAEAFVILQKEILPRLFMNKSNSDVFRVWVAGCASGEEAYSIAMLIRELMDKKLQGFKVQIYATDLDEETITFARSGIYPPNITQDVIPERLHRFFHKENTGYRVKKEIREMMVFATQNVMNDPPFTKLDFLSCRNLLIYLKPEHQNQLVKTFHYALNPGGILLLSPSENIGNHTDLFSTVNRNWKIYSKSDSLVSHRAVISHFAKRKERGDKSLMAECNKSKEIDLVELTRRLLLQYFAPPSVITDLKGNALYVHGDTGKYLRPAPGHASLNIIEMAREGLASELRKAIQKAVKKGVSVIDRQAQVRTAHNYIAVNLSVRPMPKIDYKQDLLLVSFQDVIRKISQPADEQNVKPAELRRIDQLEYELANLKENHQATVEELQAANEEMQATNEELQSTNEELETSKEELQSVNEEMITVNSELHSKIEQLADMQNDMKNLLENINVGIIFLNRDLIIRSYTREAERIYRLVPTDIGRSLNDIKPVAGADELLVAAQAVLVSLAPYEHEIQVSSDSFMMVRIQPYLTLDNMVDGVVMAFTDITERIKAVAMQETRLLAENIAYTVTEPFIVLDGDLIIIAASPSFHQEFQLRPEESIGYRINEIDQCPWNMPSLHDLFETIRQDEQHLSNYAVECDFPDIGRRKVRLNACRPINKEVKSKLILLAIEVEK
ncbi:chemotaxis protein CheB [Methylomarinum vadi]|uniref:chemotaxis protein CheB n=1 Tax=Methylomarinum vadi TaxID=438855 RepID=UPI0004DF0262|nr:chemotaxis protein CheB [Methylomarinum vadi]